SSNPARDAIACYREESDAAAKVNWHLSGGDIGQLFLALDGMTRAYALVPTPGFKAVIETAIARYHKLDLVGIGAQTHAMLSATTGILRWYEMQHRPEDLAFAEALYQQYRDLAMTETYENYNWFNKPKWTEGCAVTDSYILTVNLWRLTGQARYLEDAHLILFNGLLPGQLRNGGFGTSPCVGPATGICRTKARSEAPFCCSMRGAEGLARAIQYSYFMDRDAVVLPFYSDNTVTLRFQDGTCTVREQTGYPHHGQVRLQVLESQVSQEKKLRFFLPPWAVRTRLQRRVNGTKVEPRFADSFAETAVRLDTGTIIEVSFQQERGPRPALHPEQAHGACRYFDGPLLLGSATEKADEPLAPILDTFAPGGPGGEPYVYFPKKQSTRAENVVVTRKASNLATGAQVFWRDTPTDKLPRDVARLFNEFKHDRASAICGFLWSSPREVRQVILQWPESLAMPKPEEVALRWFDAGVLYSAAPPGIIGNGHQWVYTLGKATQGAVLDNLVLSAKTADANPDTVGIPEVEILGNP
ncbi:MAG: glycoside hydrolase family 127 protein, partial [Candidatus Omnitrophica bacterium]|nr:glycoside hydrolase family 127 protein [Candidatus Omnitrophota bacterium]